MYGNVDAGQNDEAAAAAAAVVVLTDDNCDKADESPEEEAEGSNPPEEPLIAELFDDRTLLFMAELLLLEGTSTSPEAELVAFEPGC